jgi:hypothetical protein
MVTADQLLHNASLQVATKEGHTILEVVTSCGEQKKKCSETFQTLSTCSFKVIPSIVGFIPRRSGFNPRSGYMIYLM